MAKEITKSNVQKVSKNRGRKQGLNVRDTWAWVFKQNANPSFGKLSDEKILKIMQAEFPDKKSAEFTEAGSVARNRQIYNRGVLTDGVAPTTPCPQWVDGEAVLRGKNRKHAKGESSKGFKVSGKKKAREGSAKPKGFHNRAGGRK